MEIKEISRYRYNGEEYKSLKDVKTKIEIGAIIDYSNVTLTPKQKINIFAAIVKNKKQLRSLLDVSFTQDSSWQGETTNILDMSL